jgi:hypothetical protein
MEVDADLLPGDKTRRPRHRTPKNSHSFDEGKALSFG